MKVLYVMVAGERCLGRKCQGRDEGGRVRGMRIGGIGTGLTTGTNSLWSGYQTQAVLEPNMMVIYVECCDERK